MAAPEIVGFRKPKQAPLETTKPSGAATFRVLVVDDDPLAIEFVKLAIERPNLEVRGATTGAAALESVAEARPDLVFLDLTLPDLSGMEVLERTVRIDSRID